ncbi:MAG: dihydroorotase [Melioribacteraceae bacterium]|nr:dihydroorotase [Melioribacteraceae bacterium]
MQIVLKGITLVNPAQNINEAKDLLIKDGVIEKVGDILEEELKESKVYDFSGKYCVPGLYDMHVHLREPGKEHAETVETGCDSAAAGGFTGVAAMPNTSPCTDSAEVIRFIIEKAKDHLVDVNPIGAVTVGRKGEALAPIAEMVEAGAVGFSDDGTVVKTAAVLRSALEYSSMYDAPIIEHCEDESLAGGAMNESFVSTQLGLPSIPTVAEDLIVMRDIIMTEYAGGRVHIAHISSKQSVEFVREAKKKGIKVTAEVTPHHFTLTDECCKTYDPNFKMNPPLRSKEDVDAMIEGLKDGTIDCIASDHAPHASEDKEVEFVYSPNGIIGLETQLGLAVSELLHKKHLTFEQLVEKLSINPRKILNLPVPKFEAGEKANLTIIDTDVVWTADKSEFKSISKNSPFDKRLMTGKSLATINNNKMFFEGEFREI